MKIGLTYTGAGEKHSNYKRWLQAPVQGKTAKEGRSVSNPNNKVEVIRLSVEDDNLSTMESCDALVLSGGVDIHPSFYGGSPDYAGRPNQWRADRDNFEMAALKLAWDKGLPVLGVCRGLQLINVACGGTLIQDLGVEGDETHQSDPADKKHAVAIEEDTLLFAISGVGGETNSAHHQAIRRLGNGLRVNCRAEDGVIEGIEWADRTNKPFLLAVQWHPERMLTNNFPGEELYLNIRNRFIEEIKKSMEA